MGERTALQHGEPTQEKCKTKLSILTQALPIQTRERSKLGKERKGVFALELGMESWKGMSEVQSSERHWTETEVQEARAT